MFVLLAILLAQVGAPGAPAQGWGPAPVPGGAGRPPGQGLGQFGREGVRCVEDSSGNYACSDGSRIVKDSSGNFTVIPARK
jgi:hypothetical protein